MTGDLTPSTLSSCSGTPLRSLSRAAHAYCSFLPVLPNSICGFGLCMPPRARSWRVWDTRLVLVPGGSQLSESPASAALLPSPPPCLCPPSHRPGRFLSLSIPAQDLVSCAPQRPDCPWDLHSTEGPAVWRGPEGPVQSGSEGAALEAGSPSLHACVYDRF